MNNAMIGHNRVALVTGGSSGIGLAVARLLAQVGSHVWLVARQPNRLMAALSEVKAARTVCDLLMAPRMSRYHVGEAWDTWESLKYPCFGFSVIHVCSKPLPCAVVRPAT